MTRNVAQNIRPSFRFSGGSGDETTHVAGYETWDAQKEQMIVIAQQQPGHKQHLRHTVRTCMCSTNNRYFNRHTCTLVISGSCPKCKLFSRWQYMDAYYIDSHQTTAYSFCDITLSHLTHPPYKITDVQ